MSDILPGRAPPVDARFGLLQTAPNYRQAIASLIPAMYLAYSVLIWPLLYARQYIAEEFDQAGAIVPAGPNLSILAFPALFGLAALLFLAERSRLPAVQRLPLLAMLALWGFIGLSTSWAITPGASFKEFVVLTMVLLGMGLATMLVDSVERLLQPLFWVLFAAMLVNLASVLLTPAGPIGHQGIYIQKNELGGVAAIGLLFALYGLTVRNGWYRLLGLIAVAGWLIVLARSGSKTSLGLALVAPMLGLGATFARHYLRIALPVLLVAAGLAIVLVVSGGVPGLSVGDISQSMGGERTFTGRVEVWDFVLKQLETRQLTGFGFRSFWTYEVGDASPTIHGASGFLQKAPTAHNGYLELLLWGGWMALALFGAVMVLVADWVSRVTDTDWRIGWMLATLFTFIGLHNLLESSWLDSNSINSILFSMMVMAMIAGRPARPPRRVVRLI
ncbi:MAG: O-antigen ligase family protein [Alphaproteobacteria bacterium]|nr:O-antigen ligase family protein [Alphaproteobacteria bacterium]